ncbi:hypothetical protein [Otariodibacter oris]|uniref:Uncharacterized protein n=1 Tax=Otariodibacter oris TaxID=1032623 RepID=A0A420XF09_9PAST|nr:hypothetical protein [Otariodibacter oris]QGM81456.1 hypothetical protein A6A10_08570 [Otariodibacter oris]RKR71057.1 hypothetical protein DES31_1633 [Otariodibacter oris]
MNNIAEQQKILFSEWAMENLGKQSGGWYAPYIDKLGHLLKSFGLNDGKIYRKSFFSYRSFEEFKNIYKKITEDNDEQIEKILKGKQPHYQKAFSKKMRNGNKSMYK